MKMHCLWIAVGAVCSDKLWSTIGNWTKPFEIWSAPTQTAFRDTRTWGTTIFCALAFLERAVPRENIGSRTGSSRATRTERIEIVDFKPASSLTTGDFVVVHYLATIGIGRGRV
jgi:hypothetical protein